MMIIETISNIILNPALSFLFSSPFSSPFCSRRLFSYLDLFSPQVTLIIVIYYFILSAFMSESSLFHQNMEGTSAQQTALKQDTDNKTKAIEDAISNNQNEVVNLLLDLVIKV